MARLGKEKVFFLCALLISGLFFYGLLSSPYQKVTAKSGKAVKAEELALAPVGMAPRGLLLEGKWKESGRDSFREPRDWFALPPVDLPRPPLAEPQMVPPFPEPSLGLAHVGAYRIRLEPKEFDFEGGAGAPVEDVPPSVDEGGSPGPSTGTNGGETKSPQEKGSASTKKIDLSVSQEQEFRQRYDWIELQGSSKPWYGIIKNDDKYTLNERADEPVKFQRVNPETGKLMVMGPIAREQIRSGGIHLANNAVNRVERTIREIPERTWASGTLPQLFTLIDRVMVEGRVDPFAYRRAIEELQKYRALDPEQPRIFELMADCNAALLDFEAEIRVLQEAELAGLKSGGLTERRARWLWRVGARERALQLLAEAAKLYPSHRGVRLLHGACLLEMDRAEEALVEFAAADQASATGAERTEVIRKVGSALMENGKLAEAQKEAERVLHINEKDPGGLWLSGATLYANRELDKAQAIYRDLLEATDDAWFEGEAQLNLGLSLAQSGDFAESRKRIESAAPLNPLLGARARTALSFLFASGGNLDLALATCREAVLMNPEDAHVHYFLGRMLRVVGDLEEAQVELRRALDLGATFSDLFNELGYVALLDDRPADAEQYFHESLAREKREETLTLLAHAYLAQNNLVDARKTFEQVRANSDAVLGLAYCAYRRGESPDAQELFDRVVDPEIYKDAPEVNRAYAKQALHDIRDRESKVVWEDFILWRQVGNGWTPEARYEIEARISTGNMRFTGTQKPGTTEDHWTFLEREVELNTFFEFEVDVSLAAGNQGRAGVGLVHLTRGTGRGSQDLLVRAAFLVSLEPDGNVSVRSSESAGTQDPWKHVTKVDMSPDVVVRIGLRRLEKHSHLFQVLVNGVPEGDPVEMSKWRGSNKQVLSALFFVSAAASKKVDAAMKYARLVKFQE